MSNRPNRHNTRVKIVEDSSDFRVQNTTVFGASKSTQKKQQFILNANIPISIQRDTQTTANGGTIQQVGAEYRVRADAQSNSSAILRSARRGDYISGNESEAGLGIRIPTQPTGDAIIRWGYFDADDEVGLVFEYDAEGIWVAIYDGDFNNPVHREKQQQWNINKLNDPKFGVTQLDPADGNVYQINFVYYGYGPVRWEVGEVLDKNRYRTIAAHQHKVKGGISISEPNLPLTVQVDNGTTSTQLDCFVGGRQFSTFGSETPISRIVGTNRFEQGSIGETYRPAISVQEKPAFQNILCNLRSLSFIPDVDMAWQIRINGTLTGASFGAPAGYSASECATQWDTSATAISGGEVIATDVVSGGNKASVVAASLPERVLFEDDVYSLCVRRISGTNGIVTTHFSVSEKW